MNSKQDLPVGWDADRVRTVATHYEEQSSDQAVAEDTAASLNWSRKSGGSSPSTAPDRRPAGADSPS